MEFQIWIWLLLIFVLGLKLGQYNNGSSQSTKKELSNEYFKGLNFLLNEQHDKAIESFIKALEVDSETVELHLALGGLFRRKGQVDRATRIHQNLIARPSLSDEQRKQAVFELAHDYLKAGLLDRAENLFIELSESVAHQKTALTSLLYIYEQEKDWQKAIDITKQLNRFADKTIEQRAAHYWCEMAENAIESNEFELAKKYLKQASFENRDSVRKSILEGELLLQQGKYLKAIKNWRQVAKKYPEFSSELSVKIIQAYQMGNNQEALTKYLNEMDYFPNEQEAFELWLKSLIAAKGKKQAVNHIIEKTGNQHHLLTEYLQSLLQSNELEHDEIRKIFSSYLSKESKQSMQFICKQCGFETKARYWHCPSCNEWDSYY